MEATSFRDNPPAKIALDRSLSLPIRLFVTAISRFTCRTVMSGQNLRRRVYQYTIREIVGAAQQAIAPVIKRWGQVPHRATWEVCKKSAETNGKAGHGPHQRSSSNHPQNRIATVIYPSAVRMAHSARITRPHPAVEVWSKTGWVAGGYHQVNRVPFPAGFKDRRGPANPQQCASEFYPMPLIDDRLRTGGSRQPTKGDGPERPEAADEHLFAHTLETPGELRVVHGYPHAYHLGRYESVFTLCGVMAGWAKSWGHSS